MFLSFIERFWRRIDHLCSKYYCTKLITTRVGIKPVNQILKSDYLNLHIISVKSFDDVRFDQLIAPPDFLKDEYTILGKKITEWPHYQLIRYLDKNLPLSECDYVKRRQSGTLDFRKKMDISFDELRRVFNKRLDSIKNNKIFSVKIYLSYDNFYTVTDGKHALSMAYYFNYKNIRFDIIHNICFDSNYRWRFEKIKDNNEFSKHNNFFNQIYEYRKKEVDRIIEG